MTFKSTYSDIQVDQEVISRIQDITPGNIPVMDANQKIVDSGVKAVSGNKSTFVFTLSLANANDQVLINQAGGFLLPCPITGNVTRISVMAQTGDFTGGADNIDILVLSIPIPNNTGGNAAESVPADGTLIGRANLSSGGETGLRYNREYLTLFNPDSINVGDGILVCTGNLSGIIVLTNLIVTVEIS